MNIVYLLSYHHIFNLQHSPKEHQRKHPTANFGSQSVRLWGKASVAADKPY